MNKTPPNVLTMLPAPSGETDFTVYIPYSHYDYDLYTRDLGDNTGLFDVTRRVTIPYWLRDITNARDIRVSIMKTAKELFDE